MYSQNSIRVDEGERVILPCISQAYPLPSYHWSITQRATAHWPPSTGEQASLTSEPNADQVQPIHLNSRVFQLDGLLVFKQALLSDSGKYRCVVNNTLGTALIETELIVNCEYCSVATVYLARISEAERESRRIRLGKESIKEIAFQPRQLLRTCEVVYLGSLPT